MESSEEKLLKNYPDPVFIESTKKILNQKKKSVFRICCTDGIKGTGFFCKIYLTKKKGNICSSFHI